jgi:hypothetical protein
MAMKFMVEQARATKDIDFVLDVVRLRGEPLQLSTQMQKLGWQVVNGSLPVREADYKLARSYRKLLII